MDYSSNARIGKHTHRPIIKVNVIILCNSLQEE
jgi:hypothetical protein